MIPDETIEVLARMIVSEAPLDGSIDAQDGCKEDLMPRARIRARRHLQTVAPYLMAAAWDEGKDAGWDAARGEPEESNPYEEEVEG